MAMVWKYSSSLPSSEQRQNPQTLVTLGEFNGFQGLMFYATIIRFGQTFLFLPDVIQSKQNVGDLELERIDPSSDLHKFSGTGLLEPCSHSVCVQLLWINQKVIQLPLIKSSVQQTQLEANCNIPIPVIGKRSLACQQMQTGMQCARSEQLYVSHFSWGSITCHMPVTIISES